jgi:ABC-type microcin C transport system permease subunit YejB
MRYKSLLAPFIDNFIHQTKIKNYLWHLRLATCVLLAAATAAAAHVFNYDLGAKIN